MQELLAKDLKTKVNCIILDVRQEYEYLVNHIPNSILIPLDQLELRINELEKYKSQDIIVYCKAGVRSFMACQILENYGFSNLYNLSDGILGWINLA